MLMSLQAVYQDLMGKLTSLQNELAANQDALTKAKLENSKTVKRLKEIKERAEVAAAPRVKMMLSAKPLPLISWQRMMSISALLRLASKRRQRLPASLIWLMPSRGNMEPFVFSLVCTLVSWPTWAALGLLIMRSILISAWAQRLPAMATAMDT